MTEYRGFARDCHDSAELLIVVPRMNELQGVDRSCEFVLTTRRSICHQRFTFLFCGEMSYHFCVERLSRTVCLPAKYLCLEPLHKKSTPGLVVVTFRQSAVPDVNDFFDALLGNRVETDNAAVERIVYLHVLLQRALHVHNVDRVVVRCKHCTFLFELCPRR